MVPNIDNKINIFLKIIKKIVDPPPPPFVAKADTIATEHYFTPYYAHALVSIQSNNTGPRVKVTNSITIDPQQVGLLYLGIPPAATEIHVFAAFKNSSLITVGQICGDVCQAIFTKNHFKSCILTKHQS